MSQQITVVRPFLIGGVLQAVGATPTVSDQEAADLVWRGDATYTNGAPAPVVPIDDDIVILAAQIQDATTAGKNLLNAASVAAQLAALGAGAQGISILQAATFDAFLTAIGGSLGAADSGGTGFKLLRVPNATT